MSRIFLSHSSQNNAPALAVRDWLAAEGWDDIFLDLDPERGISAGERWERALNDAANRCEVVVFLVSRIWLNSAWCVKEFHLADKLNKRMFGVLIEDIALSDLPAEMTRDWQLINLASGRDHVQFRAVLPDGSREEHITFSASGLARLKAGLNKAGLDPRFFAWPPSDDEMRAPYRGLRPLDSEDAGIFFGREAPTIAALDRLRGLSDTAPPRFVAILAASGAGKSSFLRAGLLPRLARDDRNFLTLPVLRPERAALNGDAGLIGVLDTAFTRAGLGVTRAGIKAMVSGDGDGLVAALAALGATGRLPDVPGEPATKSPTLILAIDQGEELFLSEGAAEAQTLLKLIRALITAPDLRLIVIVTIRSDAYERLQSAPILDGIRQETISLPPLPKGAYQTVIEGPAQRLASSKRSLKIEPALTEALLADVEAGGAKDALPLLAFTLERLYVDYGGDGDLTLAEYALVGGVKGSLEAAVERALTAADRDQRVPRDHDARLKLLRRGLIPWLAGIDTETGQPRRRVARLSEIPEEARPLVEHLIEARLLSIDINAAGQTTVEPAHEALLRQWGVLQGWLKEDFVALAALDGVKAAARDWEANARHDDWLAHSAGRLEDADRFASAAEFRNYLDETERAYLSACRDRDQAERHRELEEARLFAAEQKKASDAQVQVIRRTRIGLAVASVLMVAAAGAAAFAVQQKQLSDTNLSESFRLQGLMLGSKTELATDVRKAQDFFVRSAENGNLQAMTAAAKGFATGAYGKPDFGKAMDWYLKAAAGGDTNAMVDLGAMFETGVGVPRDPAKALDWATKAAAAGSSAAKYMLGRFSERAVGTPRDFAKAREWYRSAADAGNELAMKRLGDFYRRGLGVDPDPAQARGWYLKAATAGSAEAMYDLGQIYGAGNGVPKDLAEAQAWYRQAADKGHAGAMEILGIMYDKGNGVPRDPDQGRTWFEQSAARGNAYAMFHLGDMYDGGNGVQQSYLKAAEWYEKAAEKDNPEAMNRLADLYRDGHGVERSPEKAVEWYTKAAADDNDAAMTNLGLLYEAGQGVPQDSAHALDWYQKAAEKGNAAADAAIGRLYETGKGVDKDVGRALVWYQKAADLGDPGAIDALGRFYLNGIGVEKNPDVARQKFVLAIDKGSSQALIDLGDLYLDGRGVTQDYTRARSLYERAAQQNIALAKGRLGYLYENGFGVEKPNRVTAFTYYQEAASAGVPAATYNLGRFYENGWVVGRDLSAARDLYQKAADLNDVNGMVGLAALYDDHPGFATDYAKARLWYEKAAALGNEAAMNSLGQLYEQGHGIDKSAGKARDWYQKAAGLGSDKAMRNLADFDLNDVPKNYDEALTLYEKAAKLGNQQAMIGLGILYANGWGVEKNYAAARKWIEQAATCDCDDRSMVYLGDIHRDGLGVAPDYAAALSWYMKAADRANSTAMNDIGRLYADGHGVTQDYLQAYGWYLKAAELGNSAAMVNLGLLFAAGQGVNPDLTRARVWFEKAAAKGNDDGMVNLGSLYDQGLGVKQNFQTAKTLYEQAVALDNAVAMNNLGLLYETGHGVAPDMAKARDWLQKAADRGYAAAERHLGQLYEYAKGVDRDVGKARALYEKAAVSGDDLSMLFLGDIYHNGIGLKPDMAAAAAWYQKAEAAGNPQGHIDLIKLDAERADASGDYGRAYSLSEDAFHAVEALETKEHGKPGGATAEALGIVAWQALKARDFARALAAADAALALEPDEVWIETNRAHALMFLGRRDDALAAYLAGRGRIMADQRTWEETIRSDFKELGTAGLTHPLMAEIVQAFAVPVN